MFAWPSNIINGGSLGLNKLLVVNFLKAKYCQRSNPVFKIWDTRVSLCLKYMLQNRYQV